MSSGVKVFVLGYTGETGKALVKQLTCDSYFSSIVLIGRRQVELQDLQITDESRFTQRVIDFENVDKFEEDFKGCDVGFCCIGTTRGKAGPDQFVKVDRDYVVNSARVAKKAGCSHFQLVSSTGANKNSFILYSRTKGEVEEMLKDVSFERLSIYRPGMLLGKRQERRPGESFVKVLMTPFNKLFPSLGSVHFDVLAKAMINNTKKQTTDSVETFSNQEIHRLAKNEK